MKRLGSIMVFFCFLLAACSSGGDMCKDYDKYEDYLQTYLTVISDSIVNDDYDSFEALFSNNTKKCIDLKEGVGKIKEIIPNGIMTWETVLPSIEEANHYGKKRYDCSQLFQFNEEGTSFVIILRGCPRDDFDKDNEGLYQIIVYPENEEGCPEVPGEGIWVFESGKGFE